MKTKFKSQRKGAVLATVTVVSVMMVVIIAAATQLVSHTSTRTNKEYRKKQAYYVASSCVRAFVAQTTGFSHEAGNSDEEIIAMINQLQDIARSGEEIKVQIDKLDHNEATDVGESQPRWNNAECYIKIEPFNKNGGGTANYNNLKVIATATYLGQKKKVVAYLTCETLHYNQFTPKALEIIGTDGGIKNHFENLQVYGATGATSQASHDENVLYKFNHNRNRLYGNTDINGSMAVQNNNVFGSNPYYLAGVDDSKGCAVNVSRSMIFSANTPSFVPDHSKDLFNTDLNPQSTMWNYNYLNVLEGLVFTSNGASVGVNDTNSVDTYTSMLYLGPEPGVEIKTAIARKHPSDTDVDYVSFWDTKEGVKDDYGFGQGAGNIFHGNIFTYNYDGKFFNGDMMVYANDTVISGDIYLSGDLYITASEGQFKAHSIILLPGKHVYKCQRTYNADGSVAATTATPVNDSIFGIPIREDNWLNLPRAQRPKCSLLDETPYYYYPEHLMCCEEGNVSTIWSQYKSMYTADENGKMWKLDTDVVKNVTHNDFKNTEGIVYEEDGGSFKPDYIVTEDCYIDKLNNDKILIDVDASGQKNLVVVLKDGGSLTNNNLILIKNSTSGDDEDAKFVYFVSDSGYGTATDDYGKSGVVSKYDPNSFKTPRPKFSFSGAHNVIMDLKAFLHSDVYDGGETAKGNGQSLNPTKDKDRDGYLLSSNNIIMLFTEGSELFCDESNTILHASIYMPEATYRTSNKGRGLKVEPYYHDNQMQSVAIIGNLVCHHYQVDKGNDNAIVYNSVSPYSMLAYVKGFGDEHASEAFVLRKYDAS
ncbi:hypothetical protein [Ruminococcus albus]|uniref:Uncharacterized protein n=1 Tax=Ruminococcus albus TaxID=1264 RepID=A0A1I1JIB2_RUMAL|nr:hypothetical protein [Ruminococcus albus]SFC45683.1 hypothetical protein SAMN02910406_01741 [Ruminococcus albus]